MSICFSAYATPVLSIFRRTGLLWNMLCRYTWTNTRYRYLDWMCPLSCCIVSISPTNSMQKGWHEYVNSNLSLFCSLCRETSDSEEESQNPAHRISLITTVTCCKAWSARAPSTRLLAKQPSLHVFRELGLPECIGSLSGQE